MEQYWKFNYSRGAASLGQEVGNFHQEGTCKVCKKQNFIANKKERYCLDCYRKILFPDKIKNDGVYDKKDENKYSISPTDVNQSDEEPDLLSATEYLHQFFNGIDDTPQYPSKFRQ